MNTVARRVVRSLSWILSLLVGLLCCCPVSSNGAWDAQARAALLAESPSLSSGSFGVENISSQKVAQFVEAYVRVMKLPSRQVDDLAHSQSDLSELPRQGELDVQITDILSEVGLSEQEYLQLAALANSDAELGKRIAAQIRDADPA